MSNISSAFLHWHHLTECSVSGLCLCRRWCHVSRTTSAIRTQLSHRPCLFVPQWFALQGPSSSRPFQSVACERESQFPRIIGETSRRRLSWLCALRWSNVTLPQMLVVQNPLLLVVREHHRSQFQKKWEGKHCSTTTMPETKLSHFQTMLIKLSTFLRSTL